MDPLDLAGAEGTAAGPGADVRRVVVVGMGNVLTGDDALGPTVVRVLEAGWCLPPEVETVDAGTPGADLAGVLAEADAAIVVDTVAASGRPGDVVRYDRETLLARPLQPRTNPHAPGLAETLWSLAIVDEEPVRVVLLGVVPEAVEVGRPLSPAVDAAVPRVVDAVVGELRVLGLEPRPRPEPREPELWWRLSPALAGRA